LRADEYREKIRLALHCFDVVPESDRSRSLRAAAQPASPLFPLILIVDDLPLNITMLEYVLRAEGFRTRSAQDGPSALALSRAEHPDLILLDVMMPGESGFETCARLKSDPVTADIPVIFVSALDDVKSKVRGLKTGAVDYVSKPVNGEEVLARVRVHLRILENNRTLAREHKARIDDLRNAQEAILVRPEDCPEACFAVFYRPLDGASGDFYDVVTVAPGVFGYFVADVSGHGVSAAFLTSAIKALLRQYSGPLFSREDTMRGVDAVMRQLLGEDQYLTACYAHLNLRTKRLSVVSAGHPPLIVVSASGDVQILEMDSAPLGMFSAVLLQHKEVTVSPGDRFFLYTDGMIESSPGAGRRGGLERLISSCVGCHREPLAEAVAQIAQAMISREMTAAEIEAGALAIHDDLLLLAVEVPQ
jgi:sigma-B regulation protein RsbU (phosphoserine phosphatase)